MIDLKYKDRNSVAFIRYFLACIVAFSHAIKIGAYDKYIPYLGFEAFSGSYEDLGGIAVGGFFVLSGYLITKSYLRLNSCSRFLWHRFLRIFPGYWLCLVLSVFIFGPLIFYISDHNLYSYFYYSANNPLNYLFSNLFLLQRQTAIANIFSNNPHPGMTTFNDPIWTLFYEFLGYLVIALIGILGILKNSKKTVLGIFILLWLSFNLFNFKLNALPYSPVKQMLFLWLKLSPYFFMGSVIYLFREKIKLNNFAFIGLLLLTLAAVYFKLFFWIAPFVIGYGLFVIIEKVQVYNFDRFGDLSYGLYLYAFLTGQFLAFLGVHKLGLGIFTVSNIILGSLLAYLSYWWVENPFLKLKNIHFSRIHSFSSQTTG